MNEWTDCIEYVESFPFILFENETVGDVLFAHASVAVRQIPAAEQVEKYVHWTCKPSNDVTTRRHGEILLWKYLIICLTVSTAKCDGQTDGRTDRGA